MHNNHDGTKAPGLAAAMRLPSFDPVRLAPLATTGPAHAGIDRLPQTAPRADEAGGHQRKTRDENSNCAVRLASEQADQAFTSLRAQLALHGFELHIVSVGARGTADFVQRWSLHQLLPDQAALRELAERVGARG